MATQLYGQTQIVKKQLRVYDLVLNSQDRSNYNFTASNNFLIQLENPINQKIVAYGLKSATIPKTTYNINSQRNTFEITDSTGLRTVVIAPGNYGLTAFTNAVQNALNALLPDVYTVAFNPLTAKITITSTFAGFVLNPNAVITLGGIPYQLGFSPSIAYISLAGVLLAPNIVDIVGIKNVYIRVNQLTQYMRNSTNNFTNFKIDWDGCFGDIIYFSDNSKYHQYFNVFQDGLTNIGFWTISLTDEYGQLVDLNGSDWSFVIQFITQGLGLSRYRATGGSSRKVFFIRITLHLLLLQV